MVPGFDPGNLGGGTFPSSGLVNNGDGTFLDPSTGTTYDQNGNPLAGNGLAGGSNPAQGTGSSGLPGLGSLSQLLGVGNGSLLPLLAGIFGPALGGLLSYNATKNATNQVTGGIQNAQNAVTNLLGSGAPDRFAPFANAGQTALGKLGGMTWTPLNYGPLSGKR